uniref:Uncharacterized protein n=1 Tax=Physcomitrium patens TaxID=3218 RepID=A0A2K1KIV5_PHYPA|nr:hypothetical protein PHYPA_007387 [Physcomitrium patens]
MCNVSISGGSGRKGGGVVVGVGLQGSFEFFHVAYSMTLDIAVNEARLNEHNRCVSIGMKRWRQLPRFCLQSCRSG